MKKRKKKKKKKKRKLHYINPKKKFILSQQVQHQGPQFKVFSEGLSPEIEYTNSVTHSSTNQGPRCLVVFN